MYSLSRNEQAAREAAMEDGRILGRAEGILDTVRNMINRGYNDTEINAITALPLDTIQLERSKLSN